MQVLMIAGADGDKVDITSHTPLIRAIDQDVRVIWSFLVDGGANLTRLMPVDIRHCIGPL